MPSLVVVGAQWGDEGKGKLVDYMTSNADWVVRFQGGSNAGHTLVVDGVKTKLSLVPSGILRKHSHCLIGAGVVINPVALGEEFENLRKAGVEISPSRLIIDREAHLVLDHHILIDKARETLKGKDKIGTTGRGIGPAYEERAARTGVRVADLTKLDELKPRLFELIDNRNTYIRKVLCSEEVVDPNEQWARIEKAAKVFVPYIGNGSLIVHNALRKGDRVVFEGAQGTLLDQTFGTVPFVTSSHTTSGAVSIGCGIGPKLVDYVLAVAKAYSTRVGSGPFPSELHDALGEQIRKVGDEFGTITGRPRRCGWFDAVAMRRAVRLNGADSLAITKLDVLSGIEKIKICIKYTIDGVEIEDVPALSTDVDRVVPQYIELAGWSESLQNVRKWHHLPPEARLYLSTIAEIIGCPVSIVSVGAERESTIFSSGATFVKNFVEQNQ